MKETRAYIIDKHVLIRQTISQIINKTPGLVLSGSTGDIEWEKIKGDISQLEPDVILLGIDHKQSPQSEIFDKIRSSLPAVPIIVITPLNNEGGEIALGALKNGAVDFITKPSLSTALVLARHHFEKRVVPMLKMISRLNSDVLLDYEKKSVDYTVANESISQLPRNSIELIVIGGCTGGVKALYSLISQLPSSLRVPLVVVQHMPKIYTNVFAEDLNRVTPFQVREVIDGMALLPGRIYIAPGGMHVIARNDGNGNRLSLHRGVREQKCRPSIDVLIRSVNRIYSDRVMGILLSGGGTDGLDGMETLAENGNKILLQDEKSALLWDLPRSVYNRIDNAEICPLQKMGLRIEQYLKPAKNKVRENNFKTKGNIFRNRTGIYNFSEL